VPKLERQGENFMDLNAYITKGIEIAGGIVALADHLHIDRTNLANAKAGRRGLPGYACVGLAQLIGEDERHVWAASELVTEKNPERRALWLPFVQEIAPNVRNQNARIGINSIL
jgi:hypothetical protein